MIEVLREVQLPILVLVLLLGALAKFADRTARGQGPVSLLPPRFHRMAAVAVGGAEALLAVALIVLPGVVGDVARGAVAVLFAAAVIALLIVRRRNPDMGCGCFGGLSTAPVGWRTIARSGLFAVAAAVTVGLETSGAGVLAGFTIVHGMAVALEALVIAGLSPELTEVAARLFHREPCEVRDIPVRRTLARLRSSDVWNANVAAIAEQEPVDVWRQGCWRFFRFPGTRNARPVDVVFGVPLRGRRPAVRAVISDAKTGAVLTALGETAERSVLHMPDGQVPQRSVGTVE
ncbi:MAG: hypothetical protein M0026_12375 [Nocardiopsaceae bacterium]|nr:hypothetical protein [Nocardiopsaceae bacterium]